MPQNKPLKTDEFRLRIARLIAWVGLAFASACFYISMRFHPKGPP